jgi:hypothetical protein
LPDFEISMGKAISHHIQNSVQFLILFECK